MLFRTSHEKLLDEITVPVKSLILNPATTVVISFNPINGYYKNGKRADARMNDLLSVLPRVYEYFLESPRLTVIDRHTDSSEEFQTVPKHCVSAYEISVVPELRDYLEGSDVCYKNSTNAFFCPDYMKWLAAHPQAENLVITGGFTDFDILQFALSQRAFWNEKNCNNRIIVLTDAVQTYSDELHDGDRMQAFALYNLYLNGIRLARL